MDGREAALPTEKTWQWSIWSYRRRFGKAENRDTDYATGMVKRFGTAGQIIDTILCGANDISNNLLLFNYLWALWE